ncbi:hypothetical protein A1O7_04179 [Cladophialophora yegresii CBS 114405]|uniref:Uncharacterized protein n=1 Tax=Cladophialophora yegresii CBS 114405 TaxID=1182544 RepID=W9W4V8_9EURO|nr:uncharacterized protein A1O7_04179 [Cladophialophora yegresii CBS 114405]EXJ60030.1 hypothetical protein A1O7_04179 [Cladophialophora yegresii CBS 114405]
MPWPAKPPMTLKEAKRAYKRDGATLRYTASQMARADRIDAREEKRKKELEKERQRVENKRKREEKADRERRVRQKMLEEGRIGIEDTWGKVTASQPRLNTFFGQKAVAASVKGDQGDLISAQHESAVTEDIVADDKSHGHQDAVQEEIPTIVSEAVHPPRPRTTDPTLTSAHKSQPGQARTSSSGRDRPPVLRVLSSSLANARSSAPAGTAHKPQCETLSSCAELTQSSLPVSLGPAVSPRAIGKSFCDPPRSVGSNALSAGSSGSPTVLLPARVEIDAGREKGEHKGHRLGHFTPEREGFSKSATAGAKPPRSTVDVDENDDFTDGIDDETFLMLCATQEPILVAPSTRPGETLTSPTSAADTRICPSPEESSRAEPVTKNSRTTQATNESTKELSESFNSEFNEIDDEDLLALVEEVEAEQATTKQRPTEAPAIKSERARPTPLPQQQPLRAREKPKPQFVAPRGRRIITRQGALNQEAKARTPKPQNPVEESVKLKAIPNPSRAYTMPRNQRVSVSSPSDTRATEPNGRASWTSARATGTNSGAMGSNGQASVLTPRARGSTASWVETKHPAHNQSISPSHPQLCPPGPPPTPAPWPKAVKRHRYPWDVKPVDEFPELGPSTQALSLELLAQVEAQIRDEERKLYTR